MSKASASSSSSSLFSSSSITRSSRSASPSSSSSSCCFCRSSLSSSSPFSSKTGSFRKQKKSRFGGRARGMGRGRSATTTTSSSTSTSDSGERSDDVNAEVVMRPSFLGKLGQSMNVAGISLFLKLAVSDASLAVPHIDCESIQDIDWFKLKKAGFTAVIFDKDNTLTIPYATEVHPPLQESMKECKQAFGNERVCVYSNSAGLEQYDPDGIEATHLERELGIRVARHKEKKPSGSGAELAKFLNSNSNNSSNEKEKSSKSSESAGEAKKENSPCEKFVFVGDRYLTDVVFGNKSGMFTIRVAPFDVSNESKAIAAARSIESYFLYRWRTKNKTKPTPHALDERNREEESVYLKTNAARSWREER